MIVSMIHNAASDHLSISSAEKSETDAIGS